MSLIRDAVFLVGVASIGVGTYYYDWRLACITVGASLVAVTLTAMRAS